MKASAKLGGIVGMAAGLVIGYKMRRDKGQKFTVKDALLWGGGGLVGGGILGFRNLTKVGMMVGGSRLTDELKNKLSPDSEKESSQAAS
jgi:hypothetical protein